MEEYNIIFKISHPSLFTDKNSPNKFIIYLSIVDNVFLYTDNCTANYKWYKKLDYKKLYRHTFDSYKTELENMLSKIYKFERDYRLNDVLLNTD